MWCIAKLTREYRKRMYRLLDLYGLPYDPELPVVCVDEKGKQLIGDKREAIPARPGSAAKYDYEYRRNGTRNVFVAVEPLAGRHVIKVTQRRAKPDFAEFIKGLLNGPYARAKKIRLVLDNLNTHFAKSFHETFPEEEAKALLGRIEFHYTPVHASWPNMAEIEISMLEDECLDRRIGTEKMLKEEIAACEERANLGERKIKWAYTKRDAHRDLSKHYVS